VQYIRDKDIVTLATVTWLFLTSTVQNWIRKQCVIYVREIRQYPSLFCGLIRRGGDQGQIWN